MKLVESPQSKGTGRDKSGMFSRIWFVILLATLLVSGITFRMGLWQLDRAQVKESANDLTVARQMAPALRNQDWNVTELPDTWLQRKVDLEGRWLHEYTIYLDNRVLKGATGFYVLTPLQLTNGPVLLVQRGWVPRDRVRSDLLPKVQTPEGQIKLQGKVVMPPSKMMELGASAPASEGFAVLRQNVDLDELRVQTKLPIVASLLQTGEPSEGMLRDWPQAISGADKNRGYAFQWFALSFLTLCLFLWFQVWKKKSND